MTVVLAIDTADRTSGVAVAVDGRVRTQFVEVTASRHSERLFSLVDAALCGALVKATDVSCVAVTVGPGSFTGVRVGVATAKGIAFGCGVPAVGVSSLEALARGAMPFSGLVVPVLDARKRQIYAAAFDGLSGSAVVEEGAWDPETFAAELRGLDTTSLLLGSGLGPYAGLLGRELGDKCLAATPARWSVSPGEVALIGHRALREGMATTAGFLAPVYYRISEAEASRQPPGERPRRPGRPGTSRVSPAGCTPP